MIENTKKVHQDDPMAFLAEAMAVGSSEAIEAQERRGQRQVVGSDRLPTKILTYSRDEADPRAPFLAAGFAFGEPDADDPLFMPATLPAGWRREGSDHAMWSYIVDGLGRQRVAIFYKAAFYDRKAHMSWNTPDVVVGMALRDGVPPVVDDEWLTPAVVDAALVRMRESELREAFDFERCSLDSTRTDDNRKQCAEIADERRAAAAKIEAYRTSLESPVRPR